MGLTRMQRCERKQKASHAETATASITTERRRRQQQQQQQEQQQQHYDTRFPRRQQSSTGHNSAQTPARQSTRTLALPHRSTTMTMLAILLHLFVLCGSLTELPVATGFSSIGFYNSCYHHSTQNSKNGCSSFITMRRNMLEGSDMEGEPLGDGDLDGGGVVMEDLMWRVEKLRLEEQNKKKFLKARARFLPYQECKLQSCGDE
mmetsp:Transcript_10884/g.24396  ORF Transcript_10884/g.24396 Transcript_10884/m.24396 type:complete len:204 (+) Transcript_10884:161-772(+)